MKSKGVLFGLNYAHCKRNHLNGCINDVQNIADFLQHNMCMPVEIFCDNVDLNNTSKHGMMRKLYQLAVESYKDNLDFVYIHYSGHGSFIKDLTGDELDGNDECLVPSDYEKNGLLLDDDLGLLFSLFNPNTRVVCVFDCCHSGTIGDIKYSWKDENTFYIENIKCDIKSKVITLSGCLDNQTSADAYNVSGNNKYEGALTSCLLLLLQANSALKTDVFELLVELQNKLKEEGFDQVPRLCSSYNLTKDKVFIPI